MDNPIHEAFFEDFGYYGVLTRTERVIGVASRRPCAVMQGFVNYGLGITHEGFRQIETVRADERAPSRQVTSTTQIGDDEPSQLAKSWITARARYGTMVPGQLVGCRLNPHRIIEPFGRGWDGTAGEHDGTQQEQVFPCLPIHDVVYAHTTYVESRCDSPAGRSAGSQVAYLVYLGLGQFSPIVALATPRAGLLLLGSPTAVTWLVVAIVVDAVNRVARPRLGSDVLVKSLEAVEPALTDPNASAPVSGPRRVPGVDASLLHGKPHGVFGSTAEAVGQESLPCFRTLVTPARPCVAGPQRSCFCNRLNTTIAKTTPEGALRAIAAGSVGNKETPEALSRQIKGRLRDTHVISSSFNTLRANYRKPLSRHATVLLEGLGWVLRSLQVPLLNLPFRCPVSGAQLSQEGERRSGAAKRPGTFPPVRPRSIGRGTGTFPAWRLCPVALDPSGAIRLSPCPLPACSPCRPSTLLAVWLPLPLPRSVRGPGGKKKAPRLASLGLLVGKGRPKEAGAANTGRQLNDTPYDSHQETQADGMILPAPPTVKGYGP